MGFKFRKRIKIAPGININLSKSGVSASVGKPGATVNIGKNGVKGTVGIPDSGLSYSETLKSNANTKPNNGSSVFKVVGTIIVVFLAVSFFGKNGTDKIETGHVTANSLRVRLEPSVNANVISEFKKGDIVTINKIQGKWSFVSNGESKGWVSSSYLSK
ncbi:DUF4236 domain-containing protein [Photobacterium frigidiphilum]|uniref:DUF4236 domain-containing protein n=1 Tax=Photobacterium frigidiphilum TaxID=264736 RepID=UPI003D0BA1A7